ncbi:MAG: hypothetical protein Q9196_002103 [Gyalolechia fulgens]
MLQIVDLEDHVSSLYCLAVLAVMSSSPHAAASTSEHDPSPPLARELSSTVKQPESYHVARQYFTLKRASKTLDLVVLKVIFACSKSCALSPAAILESLQLSNTVIEAVDVRDRQQWMSHDRGKFRKLVEKIVLYDPQSEVMCAVRSAPIVPGGLLTFRKALQFINTLLGDRPLPQELTPVCKTVLCTSLASKLPRVVGEKILVRSKSWIFSLMLSTVQLLLDESSIQDQLLWILQQANHEFGSVCILSKVHAALALVESFTTSVEHSTPLRQKLLYLLSTNILGEPLRLFLGLTPHVQLTSLNHDDVDICPYLYDEKLMALRQKVCKLFLKTALLSQSDSLSLDASLGSALLHKMIGFDKSSRCERYNQDNSYRKRTTVALFEASSTPDLRTGAEQWRERIKHGLAQNAEHQYQTIVRTMTETCQDLERRCDEIERPLREEQTKSMQLHDRLGESRLRITELESHNHEQSLYLEGLDHEKTELADSVRHLKNERDDLSNQVEGLRQALHEAAQRIEDVTKNGTNRIKQLELIHAAAIAERDEEMDVERNTLQETRARIQSLETDTARMREEASVTGKEVVHLETHICEQRIALEQANAVLNEKRAECDKQVELANVLKAERSDLQTQIQDLSNTCQALREDLEARAARIQDQSVELSKARDVYELELSEQGHKYARLQRASEEKVEELQTLLDRRAKEAEESAEESKAKVRQLESRLVKLKEEIENRESELEEAQGLTNQVMAFWNKQRRRNGTIEGPLAVPKDDQGNRTSTSHQAVSPTEPRETPPGAKRTRTQQRFSSRRSIPDKAGPVMNVSTPGLGRKATSERQPLRDLDVSTEERLNITPMVNKARTKTPKTSLDKDRNHDNTGLDIPEGSFCDSDFFASSDQRLIAGYHAKEPQEVSDDTTMEF